MLKKRPRVDMPNFVPCPADQKRDTKYAALRQREQQNRRAIRQGRKHYDKRPTP